MDHMLTRHSRSQQARNVSKTLVAFYIKLACLRAYYCDTPAGSMVLFRVTTWPSRRCLPDAADVALQGSIIRSSAQKEQHPPILRHPHYRPDYRPTILRHPHFVFHNGRTRIPSPAMHVNGVYAGERLSHRLPYCSCPTATCATPVPTVSAACPTASAPTRAPAATASPGDDALAVLPAVAALIAPHAPPAVAAITVPFPAT